MSAMPEEQPQPKPLTQVARPLSVFEYRILRLIKIAMIIASIIWLAEFGRSLPQP